MFGDEVRDRFLGAHERILVWMDKVKKATSPHFEEAHELLFQVKKARMVQGSSSKAFEPRQSSKQHQSSDDQRQNKRQTDRQIDLVI
jgi:glutathione S-transferase